MLLKDKVILVTGSTNGIGSAIARYCVDAGAKVMLHGRSETHAKAACKLLGEENVDYVLADLEHPEACFDIVPAVVKRFGRIDGVVNNAGRSPRHTIDTLTGDNFDRIVRLNLRAPLFITQDAVKAFRQQKSGGAVVNIGSINAHCGQADLLAYSITKGGLMTMTRNLGNALSHEHIRVNQLNVGWTLTPNESQIKEGEGFPGNWEAKVPKTYAPTGRLLRPENIAPHVVFWLSDASAPANGVVYELEQYPVVGRNLINEIPLETFKE